MKIKPVAGAVIGLTAASAAYVLVQKRKEAAPIETARAVEIHGFVRPGYEAVREAFAENFSLRREIGAACCVYHKFEKVFIGGDPRDVALRRALYSAMTAAQSHKQ